MSSASAQVSKTEEPATHTPGPWKVHLTDETVVIADGADVATTFQGQGDYESNYNRRAADACLIAAAPELYEALRWVERTLDAHGHVDAESSIHNLVSATLQKARGE